MKVNLAVNNTLYKRTSTNNKSDTSFCGHLVSLLPGKQLKALGQKFVKAFEMQDIVKDFPADTYIYKKGDYVVMNTMVITSKGIIKPIITKMHVGALSFHDSHSLETMLISNHSTAKINMKPIPAS